MKLKKNVAAKIIAICLAATMLMGICSASAVTAPKQNGISVGNPVTTARPFSLRRSKFQGGNRICSG